MNSYTYVTIILVSTADNSVKSEDSLLPTTEELFATLENIKGFHQA